MDFSLTPAELELRKKVRALAETKFKPLAKIADETDDLIPEILEGLRSSNLFAYAFPKEYGGFGIKVINLCLIREELSRVCLQADTAFTINAVGAYPIIIAGSEAQKNKYLPPMCRGERLGSFAITEPQAGSDVAALQSTAIVQDDSFILNGQKRFTFFTGIAEVYIIFARLIERGEDRGLSAFIVEKGSPGFDLSRRMKIIASYLVGEPRLENCRIPKENLLGLPGEGMKIAMSTLDVYRTAVGAAALGMAEAAYEEALNYVLERKAFGMPLAQFQTIQFKLAEMAAEIEAARLLVYKAAWLKDSGKAVTKEAAMAKFWATDAAQRVIDEAVQIFGGLGVVRGVTVERLYREVRATRIYEGANEVQKLIAAREILKEVQKGR